MVKSLIKGYRDIFSRLLEPEKAGEAFEVLDGYYRDGYYKSKETDREEIE